MHVACFSTDEGFVHFDVTTHLSAVLSLMGEPDAMKHEPRCFLTHSKRSVNLPGADSVLSVRDEPHCRKPFIETERRVFEYRAGFDGELALRMFDRALPALMLFHELHLGIPAGWANYASIAPALPNQEFHAVLGIGVVDDCGLEGCGNMGFSHTQMIAEKWGLVKSIDAEIPLKSG